MRIRYVPTASGKTAVQVVSKTRGVLTVHKHIGSFATAEEKQTLQLKARQYIEDQTRQAPLFPPASPALDLGQLVITQSRPLLTYNLLKHVYRRLGFDRYPDPLIRDLVIARIYRPASKRETREILTEDFNRRYCLKTIYRHLKAALQKDLKASFQQALIQTAKTDLGDSLRLLFYDVTTLAFDSQAKAGLKDFGFSKDHRHHDTQVVVGLVVNHLGFPLYFDVFPGSTFEGHTFIRVVKEICRCLNTDQLVIVADAAMISQDNMTALDQAGIGFIVGARPGNLPKNLKTAIAAALSGKDGSTGVYGYKQYRLICSYSASRAAKDRSDRNRQLAKARTILKNPAKLIQRCRFIQKTGGKYRLNQTLFDRVKLLEGIKGYVTNTELAPVTVIDRYHDLWRIEKDFRVTKSDLEARPIFHRLDETITAHLVIVFAALAVCRYIEIKSGLSINQVLKLTNKILTHSVLNPQTGQQQLIITTITNEKLQQKIQSLKTSLGY